MSTVKLGYVTLSNQNRILKKQSPKLKKVPWKKQYQKRRESMVWKISSILYRNGYHLEFGTIASYSSIRNPQPNCPTLYYSNQIVNRCFIEEQNRLAVYFGGKPKYRKISRMDKVRRKQELGLQPRKNKLSYIFIKLDGRAVLWGKVEGFRALQGSMMQQMAQNQESGRDEQESHYSSSE